VTARQEKVHVGRKSFAKVLEETAATRGADFRVWKKGIRDQKPPSPRPRSMEKIEFLKKGSLTIKDYRLKKSQVLEKRENWLSLREESPLIAGI